jgi:DNA-binding Lrp family transcriptional regulator
VDDLSERLLAELHANDALGPAQLAPVIGASEEEVRRALDGLVGSGHLERNGDRLVPVAGTHPTPGIFVASEREDAEPLEVDDRE